MAEVAALPDLGRYWIGQLVSDIGSEATTFVLLTYVYLETGSLWQFALLFAVDNIPDIVLSPVAGVLVDRYDRRVLHLLGDGGVAVATTVALGLWTFDALTVGWVYALVVVIASFEVLQGAAAEAVYQQLVPPRKLVRAGALLDPVDEVTDMIGPAVGAVLLALAGAGAVFVVDLLTFGVALWTLATLSHPEVFRSHVSASQSDPSDDGDDADHEGSVRFFWQGIRFVFSGPGVRFLFVYGVADSFLFSTVLLMVGVAALEVGQVALLAAVQGAAAIGSVVGIVLVALVGLWRRRVITYNVIGPGFAIGLVLIVVGLVAVGGGASLALMAVVVMVLSGPLDAALDAAWLAAVPKHLIGRASAVADVVNGIANLVLLLLVAPLVEFVLAPAMAEGRVASSLFGGSPAASAAPLLLVLGLVGVGYVALNVWALLTPARHAADRLAQAVETTPIWAEPAFDPDHSGSTEPAPSGTEEGEPG